MTAQKKTIKEFQDIQEEYVQKLHNANLKIKEYEKSLEESSSKSAISHAGDNDEKVKKKAETSEEPEEFIDLPSGSNRKKLPI